MKFEGEDVNETEVNREIEFEGDNVVISSTVEQKLDASSFMETFTRKCEKYQQLSRAVRDMENQIEQLLDEHERDMEILHAIDETQEQSAPSKLTRGNGENIVPQEAIETYVNLQQGRAQLEAKRNELEDVTEDLLQIFDGAQQLVEKYDDFEMPDLWTELVKEKVAGEEYE